MHIHMKQLLIEIDDRCARDLERVAPSKKRMRAEFVRMAIRRALDLALDRSTDEAYRRVPLDDSLTADDLRGWDADNGLAKAARGQGGGRAPKPPRRSPKGRGKRAA
jgi:hypothetical protein